jgi:hypothetical protein
VTGLMSTKRKLALTALASAALAVTGLADAAAQAPPSAPARLQVTADEFRLALSRTSVRTGPVVIELYNLGEDDHDLALRRQGHGAVTRRIRVVAPGGVRELVARLSPGRFDLWCSLSGHRARGMHATLVVRRR